MAQRLPNAQQQRCTTHKVRGMKKYLTYQQLSLDEENLSSEDEQKAKQQRRFEIHS